MAFEAPIKHSEAFMDKANQRLLDDVNRAVIQYRGIYSAWSSGHGISYSEMLVLYTIRESGYCTQKQICDRYLVPKQTIHNVIRQLLQGGILECDSARSRGREKAFALSEKGREYASPLIDSLNAFETRALSLLGADKLSALTRTLSEYNQMLNQALKESRK